MAGLIHCYAVITFELDNLALDLSESAFRKDIQETQRTQAQSRKHKVGTSEVEACRSVSGANLTPTFDFEPRRASPMTDTNYVLWY